MESLIENDYEMTLMTGHLERKYEKTLMLSAQILNAERDRIKCVERLFLEFDNCDLRSQLNHTINQLSQVSKAENDARAQLHDTYKEVERLQGIVQVSTRTSEDLHKEIESLENTVIKSEKLLADKDCLNLQKELKHDETGHISTSAVFAERDSPQRRVDVLEEQLRDEKHESDRARAREVYQKEDVPVLTMQLEETRKQLQEEIQARAQEKHNTRQQNLAWETQRNSLERKLESLQKTFGLTKDALQEARKNNDDSGTDNKNDPDPRPRPVSFRGSPTRFNADIDIATPGAVQARGEARKTALPGDKSAFSITPFLSRASALRDPSSSSDDDSDELHATDKTRVPFSKRSDSGAVRFNEPKRVKHTTSAKGQPQNSTKQDLNPRKFKYSEAPAIIDSDLPPGPSDSTGQFRDDEFSRNQSTDLAMGKAKRRKLGSPRDNHLVEDLGGSKKLGRKLAGGISAQDDLQQPNHLTRLPRSRAFGGSAGFSPLKRDRK